MVSPSEKEFCQVKNKIGFIVGAVAACCLAGTDPHAQETAGEEASSAAVSETDTQEETLFSVDFEEWTIVLEGETTAYRPQISPRPTAEEADQGSGSEPERQLERDGAGGRREQTHESTSQEEGEQQSTYPRIPSAVNEYTDQWEVFTPEEFVPDESFGDDLDIPARYFSNMESVLQNPELPTGCESVALTIALNYLGYSIGKTVIADRYLVYSEYNFAAGYVGDPFGDYGSGIFPPGLVRTANRFLTDVNAERRAVDLTGCKLGELLSYTAKGDPVVVWGTIDYGLPLFTDDVSTYKEKTYTWYTNEHCLVIDGYDMETGELVLQDPMQGRFVFSLREFEEIYNQIGQYAMTIREDEAHAG